jgi:hypothetical protein
MDRAKNKRRIANHFKIFPQFLRLIINVNRNVVLQRKGIDIAMFLVIAAGQSFLLFFLADGWHLGISQWFSYTLTEVLRGFPISFRHFPTAFLCPFSSAQWLPESL